MTRFLKRHAKKIGTPPGSLIYTGEHLDQATHISLILYSDETFIEKHPQNVEEALQQIKPGFRVWINIKGISDPRMIDAIGRRFKLHPLMLEDIMSPTQRSKLDDYKTHLYIVTRILDFKNEGESLNDEQLSMVLGENFLITFVEKDTEALNVVRERLAKPASKMRARNTDYLAYAILDTIVDSYFFILEKVDHELELLEDEILKSASPQVIRKILRGKRELALLRRTIWPMRDMVNQFRRTDSPLISEGTRLYAYDVYDHTIQTIETVESFRDVTSGMIDIYLSSINQKMNEVMKVLTVVATIFVPLTFITSLYGMNFEFMPELHSPWGYPIVLSFMFAVSLIMLWVFRKKGWI